MSPLKNQAIQTALTGDWTKAIDLNKSLLKEKPDDIEALNRMALAYTVLGRNQEAKKTYQKVLKIDPLNPIALKNIKRLKSDGESPSTILVNNIFLEETGKTKVVDLVNTAQAETIAKLRTGQSLNLSIKRSKIFILGQNGEYLGVLPDDIANRLIRFIKGGNKYEAFVKSAEPNRLTVFIRELKRSLKFKGQPSFSSNPDKTLLLKKSFKKNGESKNKTEEKDRGK